ncbi:hypothetical protein HDU89_004769 [Geranomyces variabilis]|nr:hypothetical protein HDU89_004769 [Geranomyces variabilis]
MEDWKDASALWFANPIMKSLAWLGFLATKVGPAAVANKKQELWLWRYKTKLAENLEAVPEQGQKRRRKQLLISSDLIKTAEGMTKFEETYADIVNYRNIQRAALPIAEVGVQLVAQELVLRQKRLHVEESSDGEEAHADVTPTASPVVKRIKTCISTPHKPPLPSTNADPAKRKYSLVADVVFVSRAGRDEVPQEFKHLVEGMDATWRAVLCPKAVADLYQNLVQASMGREAQDVLREGLGMEFDNLQESKGTFPGCSQQHWLLTRRQATRSNNAPGSSTRTRPVICSLHAHIPVQTPTTLTRSTWIGKMLTALWFVNPAQQRLEWLDYLASKIGAATIASDPEETWHARYVQKLIENMSAIRKNAQKPEVQKTLDTSGSPLKI